MYLSYNPCIMVIEFIVLCNSILFSVPHEHPPSPNDLSVRMRQHMYPFLQCTAFFLNCLTGIDFVHSSGKLFMYSVFVQCQSQSSIQQQWLLVMTTCANMLASLQTFICYLITVLKMSLMIKQLLNLYHRQPRSKYITSVAPVFMHVYYLPSNFSARRMHV